MKFFRLAFCLILFSSYSLANSPDSVWHQGQIVLKDGSAFDGEIYYNPVSNQVVLVRHEGKIKTFSTFNTHYFSFFDEEMNLERYYAALLYQKKTGHQNKSFYEIILTGEISLLRKERNMDIFYRSPMDSRPTMSRTVKVYDYFVRRDGELMQFKNFKKEVMPMFGEYQKSVFRYISDNNLDHKEFINQAIILDYFNQLVEPNLAQAGAKD